MRIRDPHEPDFEFFPRGVAWDVAMTRGTAVLPVPKLGLFADSDLALVFYDGGECVRRPWMNTQRLSNDRVVTHAKNWAVWRTSPTATCPRHPTALADRTDVRQSHGTGCSRYVDVLPTADGYYATWQQSQEDRSQPLVMNFVSAREVHHALNQ